MVNGELHRPNLRQESTSARVAIQYFSHFSREGYPRKRLLNEFDVRVQHAVLNDGLVRVSRHKQSAKRWPQLQQTIRYIQPASGSFASVRAQCLRLRPAEWSLSVFRVLEIVAVPFFALAEIWLFGGPGV
jgi:hypothetical protein